jgi:DNA-binding PadR family transcriptional regulator
MENTLLILGLLKLQEMHGYQLSDLIDKRLRHLTDLKKPTLYHLLGKLEADGEVTKSVSREGNRPERFTYKLTQHGAEHFEQLLRQNLQDAHAAYFNDDFGLLFLSEISAPEARTYLELKRLRVKEHIAHIEQAVGAHTVGTPAYYTLRHHELHLKTEQAWLNELLAQLKKRAVREDILECLAAEEKTKRKKK